MSKKITGNAWLYAALTMIVSTMVIIVGVFAFIAYQTYGFESKDFKVCATVLAATVAIMVAFFWLFVIEVTRKRRDHFAKQKEITRNAISNGAILSKGKLPK